MDRTSLRFGTTQRYGSSYAA